LAKKRGTAGGGGRHKFVLAELIRQGGRGKKKDMVLSQPGKTGERNKEGGRKGGVQ